MEQSYEQILQAIGFSDREAQLYLAGLKLGTAPASAYAKATGLNRVTAYNELEVMSERDVFMVSEQAASKCYTPISIDAVAAQFEQQVNQFKTALPTLRNLQSENIAQPSVRLLEGLESIEASLRTMLHSTSEVHAIFHDQNDITWGTILADWHRHRIREEIPLCILSDNASKYGMFQEQLQEVRQFNDALTSEIIISDDLVLMLYRPENSNPYAIAIEQADVVALQQLLFEQAWTHADTPTPVADAPTPVFTANEPEITVHSPKIIEPTIIESTTADDGHKVKISITP